MNVPHIGVEAAKYHLLELPDSIRRKIYLAAGLPTGQTMAMNKMWPPIRIYEMATESHTKETPFSLWYTCRTIYKEVSKIFYGENRFIVTRSAPRVNEIECDTPLMKDRQGQQLCEQLSKFCDRLSQDLESGDLSLHIWCDCMSVQAASMVAAKLARLPLLKHSTVRLAQHSDPEIRKLAQETVAKIVGNDITAATTMDEFRFFDLPSEIQLRIITFATSTGAQTLQVQKGKLRCGDNCSPMDGCFAFTDVGYQWEFVGCFCEKAHSSSTNSRCLCLNTTFPANAFLVNKEFRNLAMQVFYSRPVEVIGHKSTPNQALFKDIGISKFPKDSIMWLRKLTLRFPELTTIIVTPKGFATAAWGHWRTTIASLQKHANLSNLQLDVELFDDWSEYDDDGENIFRPDYVSHSTPAHMKRVRDTCQKMMKSAMPLGKKGLQSFIVYLDKTHDYTIGTSGKQSANDKASARVAFETELEKMVMGPTWDATASGLKRTRTYFN